MSCRYYDTGKPAEIEWFIELLERTRDMPCRVEALTIFKSASQGKEYRMTLTGGMAYIHDNFGEFFAMSANNDGDLCSMYYHVDEVFNEIN